jgi:amidohydrolase family protein
MPPRIPSAALLLLAACRTAPDRPGDTAAAADLVFRNGAVYTVDAARSWASAVGVRHGRIVYVGTDSLPVGLIGRDTEVVDLAGQMLLPGFQDGHVHPVEGGVALGLCDLNDAETIDAVSAAIRAWAAAHPEAPWVRSGGWQLPLFHGANPSKALLDRLVPDRPDDAVGRGRPLRLGQLARARTRGHHSGDARSPERPDRAGRARGAERHPPGIRRRSRRRRASPDHRRRDCRGARACRQPGLGLRHHDDVLGSDRRGPPARARRGRPGRHPHGARGGRSRGAGCRRRHPARALA